MNSERADAARDALEASYEVACALRDYANEIAERNPGNPYIASFVMEVRKAKAAFAAARAALRQVPRK